MRSLLLLLACTGPAAAPEVAITGPDEVVPIGKSVWLEVSGITVAELQRGAVDVFPKGYDVELRVLQDLRGTILIWFCANEANALQQYDILVTAPYLEGKVPSQKRLEWTIKTGEAPNPPPPPPPPSKIAKAVIVWQAGESSPALAIQFSQLRDNLPLSKKLLILDKDTKDENDKPDPLVKSVLTANAKLDPPVALPILAGLSESTEVVFAVELPPTAAETAKLLKERGLTW